MEYCGLTPNAKIVLERRYLRRGENGEPMETVEGMFLRVARHVAAAEAEPGPDGDILRAMWTARYTELMTKLYFLPNTPTFTGAGTPLGQLAACFVLPIDDDIGKDSSCGIFTTLRNAVLIQQSGGGVGFSFSRLRPKGDRVQKSNGVASGPLSFIKVYDAAFNTVAQGGTRRGASMGVLRCDHPDIMEFIKCKESEGTITGFNISVGITDAFMRTAFCDNDKDDSIDQVNPRTGLTVGRVSAKQVMHEIAVHAHANGEPGVLFLDTINEHNPVPLLYTIETTNPCGEQALGPYENCCLGSVNLAKHVSNGMLDWKKLIETIYMSVRFLDDVLTVNTYIPSVPEIKAAAWRVRRIGLGFMGLGDLLFEVGARYGATDGLNWASQLTEFFNYHAMLASIELAEERGPFPAITGSIFDPRNLKWLPPTPPEFLRDDIGCPNIDWNVVVAGIKKSGIRNGAVTTVAPTGTIGTVAGVEAYGLEPTFALSHTRYVSQTKGGRLPLRYASRLFGAALAKHGIADDSPAVQTVLAKGSCQGIDGIPAEIQRVFVVANDISPREHIQMQAAVQRYLSNSVSKTINMPNSATVEDVLQSYKLAWELKCMGLTVYRTGSRETVVLSAGK